MIIRYPSYYDSFSCIAGECEDTCCAGWEIDIDDKSYQYYMSIEGEFGERLRRNIREYQSDDEDIYEMHGFVLKEDKRCPFLDERGLCELYRELGEDALCSVCTDTPRNFLEYGGEREISLSAACAEAGRLIYGSRKRITFVEKRTTEEFPWEESEEESCFARLIRTARDQALQILQNRKLPLADRIIHYLSFAGKVQECLNKNDPEKISALSWEDYQEEITESAQATGKDLEEKQYEMFLKRMVTFTGMDSISQEWEEALRQLQKNFVERADGALVYREAVRRLEDELARQQREYEYEHLMVYYVFMCQARCVDDYDFIGRAKLAVVSFLMIRDLDAVRFAVKGSYDRADRVDVARLYARQVEHSENNLEYLAEEFIFEEVYSPESLQAALLQP